MEPARQPSRACGARRTSLAGLRCALLALLFASGLAVPALAGDRDNDGVSNKIDNCLDVANLNQIDSDGDGCGNACDADYDQSGMVDAADFEFFRSVMGRKAGDANFDPSADHDDDGQIGGTDFFFFRERMNREPGPSLIASRDTRACP
jgi:hypothetical protein